MNRPGLVSLLAAITTHGILLVALPGDSKRPSPVWDLPAPKYLEVTLAEFAPVIKPNILEQSESVASSPPIEPIPIKEIERPAELVRTIEPIPPTEPSAPIRKVESPAVAEIKKAIPSLVSSAEPKIPSKAQMENTEESFSPSRRSSTLEALSGKSYATIREPSYLSRAKTEYPAQARRLRQEGVVWLDLYINVKGDLDKIEVKQSSGFPLLDQAAVAAERKSRFRPAVRNGQTVPSKVEVPYRFKLKP